MEYFSNVKDSQLQMNVRKQIAHDLKQFEGKRVSIKIEKIKSHRSLQQNAYMHLLFTLFTQGLNDLGNEFKMLQVKEMCKLKFLKYDIFNESTGEVIGQAVKRTRDLGKSEMVEFIENVIRYAADMFHIILPYPDEQFAIEFTDT